MKESTEEIRSQVKCVKEIPLTQGKVALVDDEDYLRVSQFKWYATKGRRGNWYVRRRPQPSENRTQNFSLHQFLLGFPAGEIDHKNRDGLDNRRENLRLATRSRNAHNSGPRKGNNSGFKGVSYLSNRPNLKRRWFAQIRSNGKNYTLGYHLTPEDAAHVYDAKAKELYGEFAYLNFPETESK